MKIYILVLLSATLIFTSCSKKPAITPTQKTTVEITVVNGLDGMNVSNAIVNLYVDSSAAANNNFKYTLLTDSTGKVKATVDYSPKYYLVAENGNLLNYYRGLIPIGVFTSQTEINNSPPQTPAVVGGLKFQDTNGDGIVNDADFVAAPSFKLTENINNTFTTTLY